MPVKDEMEIDSGQTAAPEKKEETEEERKAREIKEAFDLAVSDFISNVTLVQRGVVQSDERLVGRALRQLTQLRKKLTKELLTTVVQRVLPEENERRNQILSVLARVPSNATTTASSDKMDTTDDVSGSTDESTKKKPAPPVEVDVYLQIVTAMLLLDKKMNNEAKEWTKALIGFLQTQNRRTLNIIQAKAYFYYSRCFELSGELASIRPELLNAFRSATLRHDNYGQAMLLNLLLRNYLADNLYDQANKLITKTPTIDFRSNSQLARYFYYRGRIKSVQLDYSEAYECFMQAIRKAPSTTAKGFRVISYKLAILVKLLMGEIPERNVFAQKGLTQPLKPYFELVKQVRIGDLLQFKEVVNQYTATYKKDKTYTLVQRIRQNVIRTGLKKISLAYSRISFSDIANKLHLETADDVEGIVAKAIRDGIIDAIIDHDNKYVQSRENVDIYSSMEPAEQFAKRIGFLHQIHDESVKAMRFPPDAEKAKKDLEQAEERRKRQEEFSSEDINLDELDDDEPF